ncbi:MAG: tetratricopeptide repeat protein, partial [Candidatus Omnitrophota bacterium]
MKNKELIDSLNHAKDIMFTNPNEALRIINSIKIKEEDVGFEDYYKMVMIAADIFYYANNFEKAIEFYNEALTVPVSNKDIAKCYCHIGDCYKENGDYKSAIRNYEKVLLIEIKIDKEILGKTYFGLATAYLDADNYKKTITFCQKVTELFKNSESEVEKYYHDTALLFIAESYGMLGNNEKSEEYFQ